jgi:hypothetical protein
MDTEIWVQWQWPSKAVDILTDGITHGKTSVDGE